jgi:glucokinase
MIPRQSPAPVTSQVVEEHPAKAFLGVDIGGTKVEAVVADDRGRSLAQVVAPTQVGLPDQFVRGLIAAMNEVLELAQVPPGTLGGVGIGIPGQVDVATGEVRLAVNLRLAAFPLRAALQPHFGAPILLENDVRLAALGAYEYVNRQTAVRYLACISVGTGIAAGLVLDGRLYRGSSGMAGEIGHAVVDPFGERCHCGLRGCLETVAAGPAIVRQAQAAGLGTPEQPPSVAAVYQAAQEGDPVAQALVEKVSRHLALAVHWLVMAYNVETVLFAGGVSRAGAAFLEPIDRELDRMRGCSELLRALIPPGAVGSVPTDFNAGVWGAVALARRGRTGYS